VYRIEFSTNSLLLNDNNYSFQHPNSEVQCRRFMISGDTLLTLCNIMMLFVWTCQPFVPVYPKKVKIA